MKVLIVDDDAGVREAVTVGIQLQWADCEVLTASDGESGIRCFDEHDPDVVLLDVGLHGEKNGYEVLKEMRRVSDVPVIMLTAHGDEMEQVRGLELGADDYVVKPFSYVALLARIKAVLRRAEMPAPARAIPDFEDGDLSINFDNREVSKGGQPLKLTPVEYKLLYQMVRNAGRLMPHRALLDRVWGPDYGATPDYLKVFVSRLRSKIDPPPSGPSYIESERGMGYRFVKSAKVEVEEREEIAN